MQVTVTTFYAAFFAIMTMVLANIVSAQRAKAHVSILHGDNMQLALWMRRHGNLTENITFAIILMGLSEIKGMPGMWVHAMGVLLILSRFLHIVGLEVDRPAAPLRIMGGVGTQLAMLGGVFFLLWTFFA